MSGPVLAVGGDARNDAGVTPARQSWPARWLCVFIFATAAPAAPAAEPPPFAWTQTAHGKDYGAGYGVAVDRNRATYITGAFSGEIVLGKQKAHSKGNRDIVIGKIAPDGTPAWLLSFGHEDYDSGNAIALNSDGQLVVTGSFSRKVKFGETQLRSVGLRDIFLAKLDADGKVLWAVSAGGAEEDLGHGATVDSEGNIFVTGYIEGKAMFGDQTLNGHGGDDMFLAKYDTDGKLRWVRRAGGALTDFGRAVAVDPGGYVYVTGVFRGAAMFERTRLVSRGNSDIFVAKYDRAGELQWVKQAGGQGEDRGHGIAADQTGAVYVAGSFHGAAGFGEQQCLSSVGDRDVFLAKYDAAGVLLWVRQAGGNLIDEGMAVATDPANNVHLTGFFKRAARFGGAQIGSHSPGLLDKDAFVASYDGSGQLRWAQSVGGAGTDQGFGIATDAAGNVFVTGSIGGNAGFGNLRADADGPNNLFIARLGMYSSRTSPDKKPAR